MLHSHIYTWMNPDDTLLAVAREAEARRAGNRFGSSTDSMGVFDGATIRDKLASTDAAVINRWFSAKLQYLHC